MLVGDFFSTLLGKNWMASSIWKWQNRMMPAMIGIPTGMATTKTFIPMQS